MAAPVLFARVSVFTVVWLLVFAAIKWDMWWTLLPASVLTVLAAGYQPGRIRGYYVDRHNSRDS